MSHCNTEQHFATQEKFCTMQEIGGNINFFEATTLFLITIQSNILATQEKSLCHTGISWQICKLIATMSYFVAKTHTFSDEFDYYHNKEKHGKIVN